MVSGLGLLLVTATVTPTVAASSTTTAVHAAAQTATTSETFLDDIPLSAEDLALMEALEEPETIPVAETPERLATPPFGVDVISGDRTRESIARTVGGALRSEANLLETRRRFLRGDSPILRGRTGRRVGSTIDGMRLDHALLTMDDSDTLGTVDAWMLDASEVRTGAHFDDHSPGAFGALLLSTTRPDEAPGVRSDVRVLGRFGDRSLGFRAAAEGAAGPFGLRLAGGYTDHKALRTGQGEDVDRSEHQTASASARAHVGDEDLRTRLGFDYHRTTNLVRPFDSVVDRRRDRTAGFAAVEGRADGLRSRYSAQLSASHFGIDGEREGITTRTRIFNLAFNADWRVSPAAPLELYAGGGVFASEPTTDDADRGGMLEARGTIGAELEVGRLQTKAALSLEAGQSQSTAAQASMTAVTGALEAQLGVAGPLFLITRGSRSMLLPSVADLEANPTTVAEEVLALEAGLGLAWSLLTIDGVGYYTWSQQASEVRIFGLESRFLLVPTERLELTGTLSWAGDDGGRVAGVRGLSSSGSIRYDLDFKDAYLAANFRYADPLERPSVERAQIELEERRPYGLAILGFRAGIQMGAGFGLSVIVDNALDVAHREYRSDVDRPGVDFRIALDHSFAN